MARTSATISVGADTRQLERDIQRALGRDFKFKGINEKAFTQPLGRITGAANEFQRSLDASNARVIAFGASAGLIYTVESAFSALVKSTIDVQKSLTDINVILNVSNKSLQNFGGQLFDIAKNTAQSFDTVAKAATEFSRQGLGLEETLKRTRDALILTRLSGLDTVASVEALTATINSFSNAALDSTTIINKLANVDAAFAVSSADLAEAIKRVGSSAQDVGVDFNELLAIVTSVQQTTARGGSVIGNSLKTIFTRIQRTDTLDQLERLGIEVRTLEGNTLPAITILSNLANTFNTLSDSQRAQVAETVGGVFQINILRAALGDLQKEYSVYSNALRTASGATDEAIQRNEALNQTLSALINKTFANLTKVGADIGRISFQPTFENLLNTLNKGLESLDTESQTTGGKIAKGILEGIGTFISGPGVILATAVIGKLVINLAKFASQSLQTLLNLNTQAEQRVQIQAKINQVLSQEPGLVTAIYNKQISVLDVENKILNIIRLQTRERERAAAVSATITGGLITRGVSAKGGSLTTKSFGHIPNFAETEILGALAGGYNPGNIKRINIPGEGPVIYNSAEKVKKFPGSTQPAIMPPSQSMAGKNYKNEFSSIYGFNPYAFDGFIPNFVIKGANLPLSQGRVNSLVTQILQNKNPDLGIYSSAQRKQVSDELARRKANQSLGGTAEYNASKLGLVGVTGSRGPFNPSTTFAQLGFPNDPRSVRFTGIQGRTINDLRNNALSQKGEFSRSINSLFVNPLTQLARSIFGKINPDKKFLNLLESSSRGNVNLFPAGTEGSIFEAAVNLATKKGTGALEKAFNQDLAQKPFDFEEYGSPSQQFNKTFGFYPFVTKADAKRTVDTDSAREIIQKAYQIGSGVLGLPKPINKKIASNGFIPNFAALNDAIDRELSAGVSPSRIRIGKDKRLTSAYNPLGLGVYNTKDEPLGLSQGVSKNGFNAKKTGAAAKGFIPNFVAPVVGAAAAFLGNNLVRGVLSFAIFSLIEKVGRGIADSIENQQGKAAVQALTSGLSFASLAVGGGGGKKEIGAAFGIGAAQGALTNIDILNSTQKELIQQAEEDKDTLEAFSSALSNYNIALEKLESSTLNAADRAKVVAESNEALSKILEVAPEDFRKNLAKTIESGDISNIRTELAKLQLIVQGQAANSENLAKIIQISSDQGISKEEVKGLTAAILNLRTAAGESLRGQFLADPSRGQAFTKALSTAYEDFFTARRKAEQDLQGLADEIPIRYSKTGEIELSNVGNRVFSEDQLVAIESYQTSLQNLADRLVKNLRQQGIGAEEARSVVSNLINVDFQQLRDFLNGPLTQTILGLRVNTDALSKGQKEASLITKDYILRLAKQAGDVSSSTENLKKFQNALSPENLTRYGKEVLDANEQLNANRITAEKVLAAQENLRLKILNVTEQKSAEAKYIQKVNELLIKTSGDLDKFSIALQGAEEEIILESERRRGLLFAEDYRNQRQSAREKRILGGDTRLEDFPAAFFDEFDYRTEDSFREAQLGAKDTARTIKSEFNNAFLSFARGTETASDAFRKMALNISDKIQQLALEFSTNLIFGKLFGSTSNVFGLGGGGGGLGSLFGFKKGGLIKRYSSGGTVTGGSGVRDDIPAMLSAGEYVIRKSAVKKYGPEYLQMLNEGKVSKKFFGGPAQQLMYNVGQSTLTQQALPIAISMLESENKSKPSAFPATNTFSVASSNYRDRDSAYFKYGGRVQKFATGGEIAVNAAAQGYGPNTSKFMGTLYDNITSGGGGLGKVGSAMFLENMIKTQNKNMFDPQPSYSASSAFTSSPAIYREDKDKQIQRMFAGGSVLSKINPTITSMSITKTGGRSQAQGSSQIQGVASTSFSNGIASNSYLSSSIAPRSSFSNSTYDNFNTDLGKDLDYGFKYGGRVQRFATGGEASFIKDNFFAADFDAITVPETGQTLYRPKEGRIISEGLNIRAILDSNNPQNEARKRAEDYYINRINEIDQYLEYVADVRKANEEAYAENQRMNQEIRDEYNKQKKAASKGAWYQALFGLLGFGLSFTGGSGIGGIGANTQSKYGASSSLNPGSAARSRYLSSAPLRYSAPTPRALGGYIEKFAKGGGSEDNIPALLMGGEFIMRKEAVNLYGKKFFDDLNSGRVKKFASGGAVGASSENNSATMQNYAPTNNVNVTVNLNQQGVQSETTQSSNSEDEKRRESERTKDLADKVKVQVIRVITEQQRPGGLLSSAVYKKIG